MAKKPETPQQRTMIGEPFNAYIGLKRVEAAIYNVEDYGHRILIIARNPSGSLKPPTAPACLHGRPMVSIDVQPGDRKAYARLCSLCAWETAQLEIVTRGEGAPL